MDHLQASIHDEDPRVMVHQSITEEKEISGLPGQRMAAFINEISMKLNPLNQLIPDVLMLGHSYLVPNRLAKILEHKGSQAKAVNPTHPAAAVVMIGNAQVGQSLRSNLMASDHAGPLRISSPCLPS